MNKIDLSAFLVMALLVRPMGELEAGCFFADHGTWNVCWSLADEKEKVIVLYSTNSPEEVGFHKEYGEWGFSKNRPDVTNTIFLGHLEDCDSGMRAHSCWFEKDMSIRVHMFDHVPEYGPAPETYLEGDCNGQNMDVQMAVATAKRTVFIGFDKNRGALIYRSHDFSNQNCREPSLEISASPIISRNHSVYKVVYNNLDYSYVFQIPKNPGPVPPTLQILKNGKLLQTEPYKAYMFNEDFLRNASEEEHKK